MAGSLGSHAQPGACGVMRMRSFPPCLRPRPPYRRPRPAAWCAARSGGIGPWSWDRLRVRVPPRV